MAGEAPFPHGPADITAPWLSQVLGIAVEHVVVTAFGTGQTGFVPTEPV